MPKYSMTQSRYIGTTYVKATPDNPAVIELEDGVRPGPDMKLLEGDEGAALEKLVPHYSLKGGHPQSVPQLKPNDAPKRASGHFDLEEYIDKEGNRVTMSTMGNQDPARNAAPAVPATDADKKRAAQQRSEPGPGSTPVAASNEDATGSGAKHHRASDKKVL